MKNIIYFSLLCVLMCACNKGGGDSSQPSSDPNIGAYINTYSKSDGSVWYISLKIDQGNKIKAMTFKFANSSAASGYYQESIGTYIKTNDQYAVTWSYETCNPVHTQTLTIDSTDPSKSIDVTLTGTTVILDNLNTVSINSNLVAVTEDTACNQVQ